MPQFQPVQATKFIVAAEGIGIPISVVLNKSDLIPPDDMHQNIQLFQHWGYNAIPASVMSGDGLKSMIELLQGKVSVLCGPSGVGKSSIINALRTGALAQRQMRAFYEEDEPDEFENDGEHENLNSKSNQTEVSNSNLISSQNSQNCNLQSDSQEQIDELEHENSKIVSHSNLNGKEQHQEDVVVNSSQNQRMDIDQNQTQCMNINVDEKIDYDMDQKQWPDQSSEITEELIEIGFVSNVTGKGKHTTRNVALFSLPDGDGVLADTPGFNQPILDQVTIQKLPECFPEINFLMSQSKKGTCQFRDCKHMQEPGCVVRDRFDRYEYYVNLYNELIQRDKAQQQLQLDKKKREGNTKKITGKFGKVRQEVYLDTKVYRRETRQTRKRKMGEEFEQDQENIDDQW
eukprot:TRINITY_DN4437_c0_g1_i1.p1 TRINITY_DN4437_c0_g1~~TRINITY_DN4437_c0_g1_i1.p1  ORF type:complete len:402 (+),score=54.55 TRINITY_DN4437_c0_g1_i1:68-1273(+)